MSTQSTDTSPLILRRKLEALLAELRAYGEAAKRDFAVPYSNLGADDVPGGTRVCEYNPRHTRNAPKPNPSAPHPPPHPTPTPTPTPLRRRYGEGFPYDTATSDYWLVEMSGLPFGLTAEMLRYPGETPYHFKGMLFGSSNRWQGGMDAGTVLTDPFVPVALWRLWREVGIERASLFGFWLEDDARLGTGALPVRASAAGGDAVKVTTYLLPTQAVLAVASFAPADVAGVSLVFNATLLASLPGGLSPRYCLHLPALPPFQPDAATFALNASFTVPKGQGFIFLLALC